MFINTGVNAISTAANTPQVHGHRQECQTRSQLGVTALCCGLCSKQKQLKNPTEECFKEQSLTPLLLPSFQDSLVVLAVKISGKVSPFPLSLSSGGSQGEEATAWEDTGGIPGSPEGHPQPSPGFVLIPQQAGAALGRFGGA